MEGERLMMIEELLKTSEILEERRSIKPKEGWMIEEAYGLLRKREGF